MPAPTVETVEPDPLRGVLRDYLEHEAPVVGALTEVGRTASFVSAFQPCALLVPEELGGAGASVADALVVAAESGGALLDGSVLAAILATRALASLAPGGKRDALLSDLAAGRIRVAAPVWLSRDQRHGAARGSEPVCTVLSDPDPTHALAFEGFDDPAPEPRLLLVDLAGPGVRCDRLGGIDPTRPISRVQRPAGMGAVLATGDEARGIRLRYLTFARLAVASEQGAGARRCIQMSVDYAKARTQFGVPIATFQAVKHTCATMQVNCLEAQALIDVAARALSDGDPAADQLASQAKVLASEAFTAVSRSTIEVHGGIGFVWDHPVQLFYKRALATSAYFGSIDELHLEIFDAARTAGWPRSGSV